MSKKKQKSKIRIKIGKNAYKCMKKVIKKLFCNNFRHRMWSSTRWIYYPIWQDYCLNCGENGEYVEYEKQKR